MMTSAVAVLIFSISLSSVAGETQDRFFFGGLRPGNGFGGFRPGHGFGGGRPGHGFGGGRPGNGVGQVQSLGSLFTDAGILPTFLDSAPASPMRVSWDSGYTLSRPNQTVDTADLLNPPSVMFREAFHSNSLHTIMIVDFGVVNGGTQNLVHWLVSNVPRGDISQGDENIDYLPPFSYKGNADETSVVDTGDVAVHQTAILAFRQSGRITVTENLAGCVPGAIFGRSLDVSSLISKYNLAGPVAGNLMWTKYNEATDKLFCYVTKCEGFTFPFPIAGVTDQPECSQ